MMKFYCVAVVAAVVLAWSGLAWSADIEAVRSEALAAVTRAMVDYRRSVHAAGLLSGHYDPTACDDEASKGLASVLAWVRHDFGLTPDPPSAPLSDDGETARRTIVAALRESRAKLAEPARFPAKLRGPAPGPVYASPQSPPG